MKKITLILTALLTLHPTLIGKEKSTPEKKTFRQRIAEYKETIVAHSRAICSILGCSILGYCLYRYNQKPNTPPPPPAGDANQSSRHPSANDGKNNNAAAAQQKLITGAQQHNQQAQIPPDSEARPAESEEKSDSYKKHEAAQIKEFKRLQAEHQQRLQQSASSAQAPHPDNATPRDDDDGLDLLPGLNHLPKGPQATPERPQSDADDRDVHAANERARENEEINYKVNSDSSAMSPPNPDENDTDLQAALRASIDPSYIPPQPTSAPVTIAQGPFVMTPAMRRAEEIQQALRKEAEQERMQREKDAAQQPVAGSSGILIEPIQPSNLAQQNWTEKADAAEAEIARQHQEEETQKALAESKKENERTKRLQRFAKTPAEVSQLD